MRYNASFEDFHGEYWEYPQYLNFVLILNNLMTHSEYLYILLYNMSNGVNIKQSKMNHINNMVHFFTQKQGE